MSTTTEIQAGTVPATRMRPGRRRLGSRTLVVALMFLAPSLAGLFALQLVPIGTALVLGVSEWNIIDPMEFVGLKNFREVVTDSTFFKSLYNTFYLTVGLEVLNTVLGLLVALLLRHSLRFIGLYRTIYILPLITTWAAVAIAWRYMYSLQGPINDVLTAMGMEPVPWLSRPELGHAGRDHHHHLEDPGLENDHPAGRVAVHPHRILRGLQHRRGLRQPAVLQDYPAAAVARPLLRAHHRHHQYAAAVRFRSTS